MVSGGGSAVASAARRGEQHPVRVGLAVYLVNVGRRSQKSRVGVVRGHNVDDIWRSPRRRRRPTFLGEERLCGGVGVLGTVGCEGRPPQ